MIGSPISLRIRVSVRLMVGTLTPVCSAASVWDAQITFGDSSLPISSVETGRDFAKVLDQNNAALMRGHGCTVAGRSIREAVYRAVYLEVNAELQMQASRFGPITFLSEGEIRIISERLANAKPNEGYDRAWEYWCRRTGSPITPGRLNDIHQ